MSRPTRITLTPDAVDRNGIATAQTLTATDLSPVLNGALTSGYDVNAVCEAQTTGAAAALTIVGPSPGTVRDRNERLIFTTASDNTGITFAVVGKQKNEHGLLVNVSETVTGPDAGFDVFSSTAFYTVTSITSSGAVTGNVEVGINGVATFDTPQHVTIWATSDESGGSFTITGTDRNGDAMTETIVGPTASATVVGSKNFKTVTHVLSPAAATAVEIGVDGTCESKWIPVNYRARDFNAGLGVVVSSGSTLTYTVQHTFDDVFSSAFDESTADTFSHDTLAAQSATLDGNYINPPTATRLALTAHTTGTATYNVVQSGGA